MRVGRLIHQLRRRPGFTLVELCIVIVLVTILATVAIGSNSVGTRAGAVGRVKAVATRMAGVVDANYLITLSYPMSSGFFSTNHAEVPRAGITNDPWAVTTVTVDGRGAIIQAKSVTDATIVCTVGVGSLVQTGQSCTGQ